MAYRIDYKPVRKLHNMNQGRCRRVALSGVFFLLFLSGVWHFWPEGKIALQEILFSGDVAVRVAALDDFADQFGNGVILRDAFEELCRKIFAGG